MARTLSLAGALAITPGEVVAFVGGGGKTTTMFRLADELAAAGHAVLTTTTTHIGAQQIARAPIHIEDPAQVATALARSRHVLLTGGIDPALGKSRGIAPATLCALARGATILLVEADGARRLPFKAPAAHEPVVPECASLVVPIVGIDALGVPLNAQFVHRPEQVSAIADGTEVNPEMIARVLADRRGGLKGVPAGARVVPVINKIETEAALLAARSIAHMALAGGRIAAVVLAAVGRPGPPVIEVLSR